MLYQLLEFMNTTTHFLVSGTAPFSNLFLNNEGGGAQPLVAMNHNACHYEPH